jgi:hypothetical protein
MREVGQGRRRTAIGGGHACGRRRTEIEGAELSQRTQACSEVCSCKAAAAGEIEGAQAGELLCDGGERGGPF